ncbi:MAG: response regulator transcription factor [Deltaproteobacteria bacterium]|nr:response regulator transcription factor [Deltaproteobacteria bacterium]
MPAPVACIRVLIADDNVIARAGIKALLLVQDGISVVGEADDGVRAVEQYRALLPDVLVVDMRMPRLDGAAVASAVLREFPAARILVLTHYDGEETVMLALRAGVHGYLTKDTGGPDLVHAIRAVHGGQRYLPPSVEQRLSTHLTLPALTLRERQVLEAIYHGFTNKQIATKLGVTERTAGFHVGGLLAKLGAKTRTEAVAIALNRGLLQAPGG